MKLISLTEAQFQALLELTSIKHDSATGNALHGHLVLGYSKRHAFEAAGITSQVMNRALVRLSDADTAARTYIASLAA